MTLPRELPVLYTSRWQNKKLADCYVIPVGTSRGTPRFKLPYRYRLLRLLAPSREAFGTQDDQEFERVYLGQLEKLGVDRIANQLGRISHEHDGKPLALLCFENVLKGEACHRRMFADWWKEQTGQEVPELDGRVEVKPPTLMQEMLFGTKEVNKG